MTAAMMDMDTNTFDWANDAFVALNDVTDDNMDQAQDKWAAFSQPQLSMAAPSFTIPPALLSETSVERYGQITPPEELSPVNPCVDPKMREGSVPVEQLRDELSWPMDQQMQALANYQPTPEEGRKRQHDQQGEQEKEYEGEQDEQEKATATATTETRATKRRRTSKASTGSGSGSGSAKGGGQANPSAGHPNPQSPKRKRGRPKSTVETFTAEGYPVQVSSARQSHLEKNRVAAHKCRQRKKEYIGSLETRARDFSSKNKILRDNVALLREEVLSLKNEVLRHAGCGFWAVDEYLARCAGDLLGMDSQGMPLSQKQPQMQSPTLSIAAKELDSELEFTADSILGKPSSSPEETFEDYAGMDLLEDLDDDGAIKQDV